VLDKPAGVSSAAAVAKAKRALDARKAGHAGTLDPAATGLLAIALGEATKTVGFVADARKAYRFTVRWGAATATDDAEGAVIATAAARPDEAAIRAALPAFTGEIMQVPPRVSAVKVEGERAYARARAGEALELAARPLRVERLELVAVEGADTAVFEMVCGKGGYVRSIARDLGERLGCLGHVLALRRLWSGPFTLEQAVSWGALEARDEALAERLLPVRAALGGLPEIACAAAAASRLRNGNPVALPDAELTEGATAWASLGEAPVAVGVWRGGALHPTRVFALP
jgi:tRNA pseudouridine55 synthase